MTNLITKQKIQLLPIEKVFADEVHLWRRRNVNLHFATATFLLQIIPSPFRTALSNV